MASVTCPHCVKSVNVPDGMGGKQMRCPGCRKVFPIPGEPVGAKAAVGTIPLAVGGIPALVPPPGKAAAKVAVKASGPSNQGLGMLPPVSLPAKPSHPGMTAKPPVQPGPPLAPRPSHPGVPKPAAAPLAPHPASAPAPLAAYPHIEKPAGQPARLQRVPGIRVAQIVMDYLAFGWSPEEMCRQHPHLSPADVHVAMAYYYDNRNDIELEIMNELNQVSQDQAKAHPSPALLRMRMN